MPITCSINDLVLFLDHKWSHLMGFDSDGLMSRPRLASYAAAIHAAGAPVKSIIGFIDRTVRHVCRPSKHPNAAYTGHKKYYVLKFQAIRPPNGMFGHLFGPVEGRHADPRLLNQSKLVETLQEHETRDGTDENTQPRDRYYQIIGDPAYGISWHIQSPFAGPGVWTEDELRLEQCNGRGSHFA
jgi:nuclease HARBI1